MYYIHTYVHVDFWSNQQLRAVCYSCTASYAAMLLYSSKHCIERYNTMLMANCELIACHDSNTEALCACSSNVQLYSVVSAAYVDAGGCSASIALCSDCACRPGTSSGTAFTANNRCSSCMCTTMYNSNVQSYMNVKTSAQSAQSHPCTLVDIQAVPQ
jgi:hypothetical protein